MTDLAYWFIAHLWGKEEINELIFKVYQQNHSDWETFFSLEPKQWQSLYQISENQVCDLLRFKSKWDNVNKIAQKLIRQGIEIIPINSPDYPKILKENLGMKHAPSILYIKGNKELLQKKMIAIVGARKAHEVALQFTDTIAKVAATNSKVVVSGFAQGVDRQALDSVLKYGGQSTMVLPQGILTFSTKEYHQEVENGNLLIISTFLPSMNFNALFAGLRNTTIYGLADEIYIPQSKDQGGTWSGAMDGLKRGRTIFVRQAEPQENCANNLLIESGAIAVDCYGNPIQVKTEMPEIDKNLSLEEQIIAVLKHKPQTAQQLIFTLNLQWTPQKLSSLLKKMNFVKCLEKTKPQIFRFCEDKTTTTLW